MTMKSRAAAAFRRSVALLTVLPLAAAAVALGPAISASAAEPLPTPALLYTFDDSSTGKVANSGSDGSKLDGVIRGGSVITRADGATASTGTSGVFPGVARSSSTSAPYVEIPDGLFDGSPKAMTVSTWIKWDGRFADQLPWAYIVGSNNLPGNNWGIYYVPTEDGKSKAVANSGAEVKAVASPLQPNVWTYLTTVVDGSTIAYYLNGVLVSTEPVDVDVSQLTSSSSTFSGLIGRVQWATEFAAYFPGQFDEFAVYRSALDADQVAELFATYAGKITDVQPGSFDVDTPVGIRPELPATVKATYSGGSTVDIPVAWDAVPAAAYAEVGSTFSVNGTVPGWSTKIVARVTVQQRQTEAVSVDFGTTTGAFRGGASGTLYGLGDEQSPTQALVNGAAMTNISQKPPLGTQHPGGDVFNVEDTFFAKWGKELCVYAQDYYPDWPYHGGVRPGDDYTFTRDADGNLTGAKTEGGDGVWDYLEILEIVADKIATKAENPEKYVFIPFNEPDWIWYRGENNPYHRYLLQGGQSDSYTPDGKSDWQAAWDVITNTYAKHGLKRPKIAGPGDSVFRGSSEITDFLTAAKKSDTVPDIYVWHELGGYVWMPDRMKEYEQAATDAGIKAADLPQVNITEWGASNDMSSPASILRWFASMEAAKADAQTAYWTASGTLSDNQAMVNSANGGWWLFKWYGDLNGSTTVKVDQDQQTRAIGAIDADDKRAQVIYGGVSQGKDAQVQLKGLDTSIFGDEVDIEVREDRVSGTDGQQTTPRVVAAKDSATIEDGKVEIRVPSSDSNSAFQVIVTPASDRNVEAEVTDQAPSLSIEAEDTALTGAGVRTSPASGYRSSNGEDVWGFDNVKSRSDWTVSVPEPGLYRLQVIGASPGVPVQHALFVDDGFSQRIQYGANAMKPWQTQSVARGSAEVYVQLTKGEHTLSIRTSQDSSTLLPNAGYSRDSASGVTLDRYTLTRVGGGEVNEESQAYPAETFRLAEGAELAWSGDHRGWASIGANQRADVYPATLESGYYDVDVAWAGTSGSALRLDVNGRAAATFSATGPDQKSTVRVHLPQGISEFELFGADGVTVGTLSTKRAAAADAAIVRVQAEDLSKVTLGGTAAVQGFGTTAEDGVATNGSGSGYVKGLGITDRNPANEGTLTIARQNGFLPAGEYDATVHYSNDVIEGTHSYNPQVVDLGLQAKEAGSDQLVGRTTFRYTYLKSNFWEARMPLTLKADGAALQFGNTRETLYIDEGPSGSPSDDVAVDGYAIAPNVDWIEFAPFVVKAADAVTVTPTLTSTGGENAAGWRKAPVAITFASSAADATVQYRLPGEEEWTDAAGALTISTDGTTVVSYRAVRGSAVVAGSEGTTVVKLDRTAPLTSAVLDPASGTAFVGSTVTARFDASDATSGVSATEYSTDGGKTWTRATSAGVSFTAVGSHVVHYRSVDVAGNVEAAKKVTLTVAKPSAVVKVKITSAQRANAAGWYREDVVVALSAPKSGQKVQYRINGGSWRNYRSAITVEANGTTVIGHRLLSNSVLVAGSTGQTPIKIDQTAPSASASRTPATGTGSPRNPISITLKGSDTVSGVDHLQYRINRGSWKKYTGKAVQLRTKGDYVVSYRAVDNAGNVSRAKSITASIKANATTRLKASSSTVKRGAPVTLTLTGFVRWDDVVLTIGGKSLDTVLTDQDGAAKITVRIPTSTPKGKITIRATGTGGSPKASVSALIK